MMGLPVIARELRVEAQRPANYWLRVAGAGVVIALIGGLLLEGSHKAGSAGNVIFSYLHGTLFIGIWIFVPLLTADCLSQEKREGTLGLLFLTPLTPQNIVAAKAVIHTLRAVVMLVAMVPAMLVPFLLGGVTWRESLIAINLNLAAVLVSLGAGLFASAWSRVLIRAVALSVLLSVVFAALFAYVFAWGFFTQVSDRIFYASSVAGATAIGFLYTTGMGPMWNELAGRLPPAQQQAWVVLSAEMLGLGVLLLAAAVAVCGQRLRRDWQLVPAGLPRLRLARAVFEPRYWTPFMRRHMNRLLDRNPIGWLQEYSWSARALKWGWLGAFGVADAWLVSEQIEGGTRWRDLYQAQFYMGMALLLGLAASAVGSFRRERENGVLELLLISPLKPGQMVAGRIFGLWSQFLPATLLLLLVWWQVLGMGPGYRWMPDFKWFVAASFLTLPVVGLWCSLLHRSFVVCWIATCVLGIGLPYWAGTWTADLLRMIFPPGTVFLATATVLQGGGAALAWHLLLRSLNLRTFALN